MPRHDGVQADAQGAEELVRALLVVRAAAQGDDAPVGVFPAADDVPGLFEG
ncbi:hypothetical protein ACK8N7_15720 [Streptomyces griseobrunneus]